MTNYEKYKDQIDWQARAGASLAVRKSDNTPVTCQEITCDECIFQKNIICELPAIEWLKAEYAEPEIGVGDEVLPSVQSKPKTEVLDKIKAEIDRQEKWLMDAGYNAYNVDIAFNSIRSVVKESEE